MNDRHWAYCLAMSNEASSRMDDVVPKRRASPAIITRDGPPHHGMSFPFFGGTFRRSGGAAIGGRFSISQWMIKRSVPI